ncbi:MAG: ankyrin repeat domain-containing protein [Planctomycetaceae bacterium]
MGKLITEVDSSSQKKAYQMRKKKIVWAIVIALLCLAPFMLDVFSWGPSPSDYYTDAKVISLIKAARRGKVKTIDRLVAEGVDVNAKGKDDITPLFFALEARNKAGFLRLLEHKANPNLPNSLSGESVISIAAKIEDDSSWLKMVLEHGGNPNTPDMVDSMEQFRNETPIFRALWSRNVENVELLIKAGADLNHQTEFGETPLMYAASFNWYDHVYRFLEAGADWTIKNKRNQDLAFSCFMSPARSSKKFPENTRSYEKVLEFLREKGVNLEAAKAEADKHMGRK